MTTKNPVGRPSELGECLIKAREYLMGGYEGEMANEPVPSISGLACWLGKHRSTIYDYASKDDEFSDIVENILALQETKLVAGGLRGELNPTITKLMLTKHGYSDKQELSGADGAPLTHVVVQADEKTIKKALDKLQGEY